MNIEIIEPIGQSETAIRARLKDLLEKGGHHLLISDTRGLSDAELIQNVSDADILLLSNRPLSRAVIEACPKLKLICVAFTANHPILKAPNTLLAPHIGFETVEAMSAKADIALHHLEDALIAAT
jgi:phosphoglycerate dehydrogenase-like enzyme